MSLRLRQLEIRLRTLHGKFGVRLQMKTDGLVIVRADNTSGKSTCVQSLIYALGLEAMLTAVQSGPPLQYAVLERFQFKGEEIRIDESEVFLEVENGAGEVITIQRSIVSQTRKANLVTVWKGSYLTAGEKSLGKNDYFVRIEGAAQRPLGFHNFLSSFLGWQLPIVNRFDGSEVPLYLECIFPLFMVEQKHGWSGVQSRMPTHFRIREMGKRAIEFVLKLDSYAIAVERQKLREQQIAILKSWEQIVFELDARIGTLGGVIRNLPKSPPSEWPFLPIPECLVFDGKEWQPIQPAMTTAAERLEKTSAVEVPKVTDDAQRITDALRNAQRELAALEVVGARARQDNSAEDDQNASIRERIAALGTDLQHYQDLKRLRDIGSELNLSVVSGRCPTCEQEINDVLLPQAAGAPPMSFDENIKFISGQLSAYNTMLDDSNRVLEARQRALTAVQRKLQEVRSSIRIYKQTLTSPSRDASAGAVRERMVLEASIANFKRINDYLENALDGMRLIVLEYVECNRKLAQLKNDTSQEDETKIRALQESFVSQLEEYGFSSITPSLIQISRESFRPNYDGFDLGFNLSASDMIRTIWAYLTGLMEVARDNQTNHIGLLVLDEPRQQQANKVSFRDFVERTSSAKEFNQQVLFLTSEDSETLSQMLNGVEHQLIDFTGKMILPLEF